VRNVSRRAFLGLQLEQLDGVALLRSNERPPAVALGDTSISPAAETSRTSTHRRTPSSGDRTTSKRRRECRRCPRRSGPVGLLFRSPHEGPPATKGLRPAQGSKPLFWVDSTPDVRYNGARATAPRELRQIEAQLSGHDRFSHLIEPQTMAEGIGPESNEASPTLTRS